MDRVSSELARLLASREFDSLEEVNAFLSEALVDGALPPTEARTDEERAQDLMFGAREADDPAHAGAMARQALGLWADCVDAHMLLAELAESPAESMRHCEAAVAAGERLFPDLGRDEDLPPWLAVETRPYMRALFHRASIHWVRGDRQRAIAEAEALLAINPNDNQGIRYVLVHWLMQAGSIEALERLFEQYSDDASAVIAYSRALHRFRLEGASAAADRLLREAIRQNVHVPRFLTGAVELPEEMPGYVGFGDESEAAAYAAEALGAWVELPAAFDWMERVARGSRGRGKVGAKGRGGGRQGKQK